MSTQRQRLTALIAGDVQGVGFRAFIKRHALDLGLVGYAENLSDGRVEVVAEGDKDTLEMLLEKLHRGPAHAAVKHVDVSWGEVTGVDNFYTY